MLKQPKHTKQSMSHFRARAQEKEIAERLGGKLVPRSGAGSEKGDVRLKKVLRLEAKTTSANSFRVTREMIQKIEDAALSSGEFPCLLVEFCDKQGHPQKEVCILPVYALEGLLK